MKPHDGSPTTRTCDFVAKKHDPIVHIFYRYGHHDRSDPPVPYLTITHRCNAHMSFVRVGDELRAYPDVGITMEFDPDYAPFLYHHIGSPHSGTWEAER